MESFVTNNPSILAIIFHRLFGSTLQAGRPFESANHYISVDILV